MAAAGAHEEVGRGDPLGIADRGEKWTLGDAGDDDGVGLIPHARIFGRVGVAVVESPVELGLGVDRAHAGERRDSHQELPVLEDGKLLGEAKREVLDDVPWERHCADRGLVLAAMAEEVELGEDRLEELEPLPSRLQERERQLEQLQERLAQAEAATAALAELNAMSVRPLDDLAAAGADVPQVVPGQGALPLAVLQAEAEKTRQIAQARLQRAGLLPAITASATLSSDQSTGPVLRGGGAPFGFGTGDNLRALGAAEEAADRRLVQARETASRRLQRLRAEARAAARQAQEAHQLTIAARKNLDMFQSQYDAGQRQVMDVVGVYETYARQQAHEVDLKYNAVLGQLEIARDLGLLADGGSI